jgi:hypothetical protein
MAPCGGEMHKTISNAPARTTPRPARGRAKLPEREAKPRSELPGATSPTAITACHRFWRAANDCDQAIKMAYDPKIDSKHWASVEEQWRVWQHDAECRAQLCKTEGLPEPLLTEVFDRLHSIGHQWKNACDHRAGHKGCDTATSNVSRHKSEGWQ